MSDLYTNYYRHCGTHWEKQDVGITADQCPRCQATATAYQTLTLEQSNDSRPRTHLLLFGADAEQWTTSQNTDVTIQASLNRLRERGGRVFTIGDRLTPCTLNLSRWLAFRELVLGLQERGAQDRWIAIIDSNSATFSRAVQDIGTHENVMMFIYNHLSKFRTNYLYPTDLSVLTDRSAALRSIIDQHFQEPNMSQKTNPFTRSNKYKTTHLIAFGIAPETMLSHVKDPSFSVLLDELRARGSATMWVAPDMLPDAQSWALDALRAGIENAHPRTTFMILVSKAGLEKFSEEFRQNLGHVIEHMAGQSARFQILHLPKILDTSPEIHTVVPRLAQLLSPALTSPVAAVQPQENQVNLLDAIQSCVSSHTAAIESRLDTLNQRLDGLVNAVYKVPEASQTPNDPQASALPCAGQVLSNEQLRGMYNQAASAMPQPGQKWPMVQVPNTPAAFDGVLIAHVADAQMEAQLNGYNSLFRAAFPFAVKRVINHSANRYQTELLTTQETIAEMQSRYPHREIFHLVIHNQGDPIDSPYVMAMLSVTGQLGLESMPVTLHADLSPTALRERLDAKRRYSSPIMPAPKAPSDFAGVLLVHILVPNPVNQVEGLTRELERRYPKALVRTWCHTSTEPTPVQYMMEQGHARMEALYPDLPIRHIVFDQTPSWQNNAMQALEFLQSAHRALVELVQRYAVVSMSNHCRLDYVDRLL